MADAFLGANSTVIVVSQDEERLIEAQRRRPALHVRVCDLADGKAREELAQFMVDHFPELNVLVKTVMKERSE